MSTAAGLLRADRAADLRNEIIPPGLKMHAPLHRASLPSDSSSPTGNGYTPQQMWHAYGFDRLNTTGEGQIIAIVDAYGSSTIQADLNTFCTAFGLPGTAVQVYYPQGTPPADPGYPGWANETSLDVEWAHAMAPGATIALVIAQSDDNTDLLAAVDYAASLGASQVSLSWSNSEYSTEGTSDFHFNVPGVTFFVSSGDDGEGVNYPTCSPYVVGVGGTTLYLDSSGNYGSETAWSGSGGGASVYEAVPSYQAGWWSGPGRGVPDVAFEADPSTGVPVYLTGYGWGQWGGTSLSCPCWAAFSALANSLRSGSVNSGPGVFYALAAENYAGYYHDIVSGNDGDSAGPGYDLVTGLGTPIANTLVPAVGGSLSSQVFAPVFFPGAGVYPSGKKVAVTLITGTSGASIRYTTDGSTPTETSGTVYSVPVSIGAPTTLPAIAYESGLTASPVTSASYSFR
ncbi:MAG: chitobiase/beta-hexosaminidase C-terminal domain-containing protein, partial [Opitutaceae bacterium]